MQKANPKDIHAEDAKNAIIVYLKDQIEKNQYSEEEGFLLQHTLDYYLLKNGYHPSQQPTLEPLLKPFYEAAWDLSRLGILRLAFKYNNGAIQRDSPGKLYFLTTYGKDWVKEADLIDSVPIHPDKFTALFNPFRNIFGETFIERIGEAGRCYFAHAYYACCVMCGAAAESILLSVAIEKSKDEEKTLKLYFSSRGRTKVSQQVFGSQPVWIQEEFMRYSATLNYWRDEASHGQARHLSQSEADAARHQILRLSQFISQRWGDLVL